MKNFRQLLEGVDVISENLSKSSKELAKEIDTAAKKESGGDKADYQAVAKFISQGKLTDAKKIIAKLDTVVLEDLITFIMGHEDVFKAMYPRARPGQYAASFARKESVEEGTLPLDLDEYAKENPMIMKLKGKKVELLKTGSSFKPTFTLTVDGKEEGKFGSEKDAMKHFAKMTKEEVEEAMSPADKAKRLKMIKQAVEKMNKSNMERAKKDALQMMKDSGMFDEELEETDIEEISSTPMRDKFGPVNPKLKDKNAPKMKKIGFYGSEIGGLRQGNKYYSAKPVEVKGKVGFRVTDEFGSFETIDLKTFAKRFG